MEKSILIHTLPTKPPTFFAAVVFSSPVTGIRLYYGDGKFGEVPNGDMPYGYATPFAELECVAEVENSDVPIRLLSPIISSEVIRLFGW